jgi:peptidoglycan/LPS O-acetylase OafA/YrhL
LAIAGLAQVTNIYRELGIDACYAWVNAHRIAFGPLCLVIAVSSALAVKPWRAFVGMRPLVFLSVISYNLYLWNLEIIFWLRNAGLSPQLSFWLAIPSSLAVATAVTYVLERPILQASAPRPVAPAAAARPAAVPVRSQ